MPSVGTSRRSTRVFLPKAVARGAGSGGDRPARVLRSGKRFGVSETSAKKRDKKGEGWPRVFDGGGGGLSSDIQCLRREGEEEVSAAPADGISEPIILLDDDDVGIRSPDLDLSMNSSPPKRQKSYRITYSRKRKRKTDDKEEKDRKYGNVFTRKRRRKLAPVEEEEEELSARTILLKDAGRDEFSPRVPAREAGISEGDFWLGSGGVAALVFLVESSSSSAASLGFATLFVSVLRWMRSRATWKMSDLAHLLYSGSLAGAFSRHGIFFLPLCCRTSFNGIARSPSRGHCVVNGARSHIPFLSVDYSALALYFKSLHLRISLDSMFLSSVLARHWMQARNHRYGLDTELGVHRPDLSNMLASLGSKVRKNKKKRSSSSRLSRSWYHSITNSHFGPLASDHTTAFHLRIREAPEIDIGSDAREAVEFPNSPSSAQKQRKLLSKNSAERFKEPSKTALAELKQNIESATSSANILLTSSDRCWREKGAEIVLESSDSGDWFLAVKVGGSVRFVYKPQEKRPPVVNRFTRAYMWTSEDGWKLEFLDRWNWVVFKELHAECQERNVHVIPAKAIPIPGVREVFPSENDAIAPFVRPDMYIVVNSDEIGRALSSSCCYDMDSADEEWLRHLSSECSSSGTDGFNPLSDESFENIVFALEKDAYIHPDGLADKDRALSSCQGLGAKGMLEAVYDYWLSKRKKKKSSVVRVFQAPPVKKQPVSPQRFLRNRRSFKQQRGRLGTRRGKPYFYIQEGARLEALHRVREAENAARKVTESAIELRRRAQLHMANAELAVYKMVMSVMLAEAAARATGTFGALDTVDAAMASTTADATANAATTGSIATDATTATTTDASATAAAATTDGTANAATTDSIATNATTATTIDVSATAAAATTTDVSATAAAATTDANAATTDSIATDATTDSDSLLQD